MIARVKVELESHGDRIEVELEERFSLLDGPEVVALAEHAARRAVAGAGEESDS